MQLLQITENLFLHETNTIVYSLLTHVIAVKFANTGKPVLLNPFWILQLVGFGQVFGLQWFRTL